MRYKYLACLAAIINTLLFAYPANANIYDPGNDIGNSFAEAIDRDDLMKTPAIAATANRVAEFNKESDVGEPRLINGLSSIKEILFFARDKLDPNIKLEADLLASIDSVWRQLSGGSPQNQLIRPTHWQIDPNDFTVNLIPNERVLDFKATYLDKVPSSPDAYRQAIDTLGILVLTSQTMNYIKRKPALEKIGAIAEKRNAQWQAYFDKSIPQWPWELSLVNGPIYERTLKNEKGLGEVPEWQMILLHPDMALEYVSGAADGDQLKPALMVELIGANFWSWQNGAKQKGPWGLPIPLGIGLITTFTDREDTDDWGYGGVIHLNHVYNIGTTVRDGDIGFFVSVNLAKLFEIKGKKAEKYLNMVGLQ